MSLKCLASLFAKGDAFNAAQEQPYDYWKEFVNMLVMLGFIIALIFITVWMLKRIMRSRVEHLNRSTGIKILERRVLSSKSSIYLVNVLGKGIIISESPAGIQFLSEFPPGTNIDLMLDQLVESPRPSFKEIFQLKLRKIARRKGPIAKS